MKLTEGRRLPGQNVYVSAGLMDVFHSLGGTHTVIKSAEGNTMNMPLPSTVYVPSSEMLCWSVHPVLYLFTLYSEFDDSLPDCW